MTFAEVLKEEEVSEDDGEVGVGTVEQENLDGTVTEADADDKEVIPGISQVSGLVGYIGLHVGSHHCSTCY